MSESEFGDVMPLQEAEREIQGQLSAVLQASAACKRLGGRDIALRELLSGELVVESVLARIGGTARPSSTTRRRFAREVASHLVELLQDDPTLVGRLGELGACGEALAAAVGVDPGVAVDAVRREIAGAPTPLVRIDRSVSTRMQTLAARADLAAAVAESEQRITGWLTAIAEGVMRLSEREQLAPVVEVAAPDLSALPGEIVSGLLPMLNALVDVLTQVSAGLQAPRTKRVVVNRRKGSTEIDGLTLEAD